VTKQEFVDRVAEKTDLSRQDAARAVDAVLETVTESLNSGEDVTFTGFGTFNRQHSGSGERRSLREAANALREEAEDLERSQVAFRGRIEVHKQALRDVAALAG
jgi:DNA-binding protein HU-beta